MDSEGRVDVLEGSTRRGWDSVWGSFVTRMDHANVKVLVSSRMSSGKGLRGLGGQQTRPAHGQTILKNLSSPRGGWEAQKPGAEFVLSTWRLGIGGGPAPVNRWSSQGACVPLQNQA